MVVFVDLVTNSWLAAKKPGITCATAVVVLRRPAGSHRLSDILRLGVTGWVTAWHLLDVTQAGTSRATKIAVSELVALRSFEIIG